MSRFFPNHRRGLALWIKPCSRFINLCVIQPNIYLYLHSFRITLTNLNIRVKDLDTSLIFDSLSFMVIHLIKYKFNKKKQFYIHDISCITHLSDRLFSQVLMVKSVLLKVILLPHIKILYHDTIGSTLW